MKSKRKYQKFRQLRKVEDPHTGKEFFLLEKKTLYGLIVISVLTLLVYFFGKDAGNFLTSVLSPVQHAPYDGITTPIKVIPDWVRLTESERKAVLSALPPEKLISLPSYNPSRLAIPFENLKWNNPDDNQIRNEKITYSVPYLGSYHLDGIEYAGSHPAVDIKVPVGTPVFAIGNGVVTKMKLSGSGFGNHIVVEHREFPSFDDPSRKVTLYSSYSHLSSVLVKENDIVIKGQLIGLVGQTGFATTPHVHFQVDTAEAPWHPYWPFTTSDLKAAGLNFVEGVNKGFNQHIALTTTVNPMRYVQKYAGNQVLVASTVTPPLLSVQQPLDPLEGIQFMIEQKLSGMVIEEGSEVKFVVRMLDRDGNILKRARFKDQIRLDLVNGLGKLNRKFLLSAYLPNGRTEITFQTERAGREKILLRFRDREFSSAEFEIQPKPIPPASEIPVEVPPVEENTTPSNITLPESTEPTIQPVSESPSILVAEASTSVTSPAESPPEPTPPSPPSTPLPETAPLTPAPLLVPEELFFSDISEGNKYFEAVKNLKEEDLITGYPDGTFRPEKEVTRTEALKFILEAFGVDLKDSVGLLFPDLKSMTWYFPYVGTAYSEGVVKGYPDGTFRPENTVTIAEFYKMLFLAAKTDVDPQIMIQLPTGVSPTDWYAPYFQEAIRRNILEVPNNFLEPEKPMTRGEVALAIYRVRTIVARP